VILNVLGWLAVADAAAAVVLASMIYVIGRRSNHPVTVGRCLGLAIVFGLPATLLYLAAWLFTGVG
jgi:hypothetical protein